MNEYMCIKHGSPLVRDQSSYRCASYCDYPIETVNGIEVVNFLDENTRVAEEKNLLMYRGRQQNEIYRNFLEWLFKTFYISEIEFRKILFSRLTFVEAARILVTGCGNGDDLTALQDLLASSSAPIPQKVHIWAQDVSPEMVHYSASRVSDTQDLTFSFSVSDACNLPFRDNFFDIVFHFGGINLMPSVAKAIGEMTRVVRNGGQVAFGDEGIAPWLKNTEYYRMMVENIGNWSLAAPIDLLPQNASRVNVTWLLENCFYFINYFKDDKFPTVDIDVKHQGKRGGTIRTRYYGKLEGVSPEAKAIAVKAAAATGLSVHDWLEDLIRKSTGQPASSPDNS
jgi:SAM-dependent methyltransferase